MMLKLDSFLIARAQWLVDRIGGDYIGQRIGRQLGYACCVGHIVLFLLDYRASGIPLTFLCVAWALCGVMAHVNTEATLDSLHRGFTNPMGHPVIAIARLLVLVIAVTTFSLADAFEIARHCCLLLYPAHLYFIATDNPPPKPAKEDVTLLVPAPNPS